MAYFVNGEVVKRFELVGMVLCFTGICLLGYAVKDKQDPGAVHSTFGSSQLVGVFIMMASALAFSTQCVFTRKLKELHFTQLSMSHAIVGIIMSFTISVV